MDSVETWLHSLYVSFLLFFSPVAFLHSLFFLCGHSHLKKEFLTAALSCKYLQVKFSFFFFLILTNTYLWKLHQLEITVCLKITSYSGEHHKSLPSLTFWLSLCHESNIFPKISYSGNLTLSRLVVFGGRAFSLEGDEVMRVGPLLWD